MFYNVILKNTTTEKKMLYQKTDTNELVFKNKYKNYYQSQYICRQKAKLENKTSAFLQNTCPMSYIFFSLYKSVFVYKSQQKIITYFYKVPAVLKRFLFQIKYHYL